MKNLTAKQIEQIKSIKSWTSTKFHGNRKYIGALPVELVKCLINKKKAREYSKQVNAPLKETNLQLLRRLITYSLETKGSRYFKILIEGNTGIYYASATYGHSDYNKTRVFAKTPETLKLMAIFNAIVTK